MTYTYAAGLLWSKLSLKIVIFSIFLCVEAHAREASGLLSPAAMGETADTITPLQIGDTIPEAFWQLPLQVINHPDGKETITLNDYRGKLILLDFWGPSCSYCIAAFPKLDSLQAQFNDELQIVLVTQRDHEQIVTFHQRKPIPNHLFSVTADSVLNRFFQHRLLPHYAWINSHGKLIATTHSAVVTPENIRTAVNGDPLQIVQKNDLDTHRPFYLAEWATELPLHYSLFQRGRYPGANSQLRVHGRGEMIRGKSFTNYTYRELYYLVAKPLFDRKGIRLTPNRWLLETSDTTKWISTQDALKGNPELLYTYELVVLPEETHLVDSLLLTTLNSYTGYSAAIRQVTVPCLVITPIVKGITPTPPAAGQSLEQFVVRWNLSYTVDGLPLPILLNESGYTLPLPKDLRATDMLTLRAALDSVGLGLTETTRKLDMLIINQH